MLRVTLPNQKTKDVAVDVVLTPAASRAWQALCSLDPIDLLKRPASALGEALEVSVSLASRWIRTLVEKGLAKRRRGRALQVVAPADGSMVKPWAPGSTPTREVEPNYEEYSVQLRSVSSLNHRVPLVPVEGYIYLSEGEEDTSRPGRDRALTKIKKLVEVTERKRSGRPRKQRTREEELLATAFVAARRKVQPSYIPGRTLREEVKKALPLLSRYMLKEDLYQPYCDHLVALFRKIAKQKGANPHPRLLKSEFYVDDFLGRTEVAWDVPATRHLLKCEGYHPNLAAFVITAGWNTMRGQHTVEELTDQYGEIFGKAVSWFIANYERCGRLELVAKEEG